ncbi:class I SAM-dependent methyltransferase [bacterium]|nr:class I SAM-dependent methyltransferase [bacterium]
MASEQTEHRAFLNRYYGSVKHVYDLTRKYYLFGRDTALKQLLGEPWEALLEIGPGTGRNLEILHRARPGARYGGVEASDEMLGYAQARCAWATLQHGYAETADLAAVLDRRPDRILFSYALSMVQDPEAALRNARRALAPGGEVIVVDFGDLGSLWGPFRSPLRAFLKAFHVEPLDEAVLAPHEPRMAWGPGHYYVIARLPAGS